MGVSGRPAARPATANSPTRTRLGAQVERLDRRGMELPHPAHHDAAGADPGGPARMEVRVVSEPLVCRRRVAEATAERLDETLRVVEVVRTGSRDPMQAARRRRSARTPSRHHSWVAVRPGRRSPCRPRRWRHLATGRGSLRRPRAGCRPGSGEGRSAGSTAGSSTVIGRPAARCSGSSARAPSSRAGKRSTIRGATRAIVTASVRPAPTSVSRTTSRISSGS